MGGETRSPCDLMVGSGPQGNRRGEEQFLLAQSVDSAKFCSVPAGKESHTLQILNWLP